MFPCTRVAAGGPEERGDGGHSGKPYVQSYWIDAYEQNGTVYLFGARCDRLSPRPPGP